MDLMTCRRDGQAVCATHHRIYCGPCRSDFTNLKFQRPSHDDSDADLLEPGANRFIPQWDDEVLGPGRAREISKDYDNPPRPTQLQIESMFVCNQCELTWLIGGQDSRAAASHPSHHTMHHVYKGTARSLVVHVDGACLNNGTPYARAGIGVYFAAESQYNISRALICESPPTSQRAELRALLRAMQVVRNDIIPKRSQAVRNNIDRQRLRLILVTDSSYAVECMCLHWKGWKTLTTDDGEKVVRKQNEKVVDNSESFLAIKNEVAALSRVGVQVVYYHVKRDFNKEADALAKAGASRAREYGAANNVVRLGHLRIA